MKPGCTVKNHVKHKFLLENNKYMKGMTANKLFKKIVITFLFIIELPLVFIAEKFYNDDEDGYD